MNRPANIAATALLLSRICFAQEGLTRFEGEVSHGQQYRREIGSGLLFVLNPTDSGWMIRIVPKVPCAGNDDWASVVNAPYRNYNSLFVDASYGITAKEAVKEMNPREFSFVVSCGDYKREGHRLDIVLWPYSYSQQEVDRARAERGTAPLGRGKLTILDSKTSLAEQEIEGKNYGMIDWLKFRLEVSFPQSQARKRP